MKKIALLICLILSLNNYSVYAENVNFSDLEQGVYYDAVDYLVEQGYVQGYYDNTIRLENSITRAELAKLAVAIQYDVALPDGESNFIDTKGHWAEGYIRLANENGIINGYPDGTFRPDDVITYDEVITIITRMFATKEELKGFTSWPRDYISYAIHNGILKNVDYQADGLKANRGDSFLMLYNSLNMDSYTVDFSEQEDIPEQVDFSNHIEKVYTSTSTNINGDRIRYSTELYKNNIESILVKIRIEHEEINEDIKVPFKIEFIDKDNNNNLTYNKNIQISSNTNETEYFFNIDINDFNFSDYYYDEYDDNDYILNIYHTDTLYCTKVISFQWDDSIETEYAKMINISNILFHSEPTDESICYTDAFYLSDDIINIVVSGDFEWPSTDKELTVPLKLEVDGRRIWDGNVWFFVDANTPSQERARIISFYVDGSWQAGIYQITIKGSSEKSIEDSFKVNY